MPIYDRPVRELLRQFIADNPADTGTAFAKADIVQWFKTNYPKIKLSTVSAQTIKATTNSKTRIYYNAAPRDDLFFQIDSGHVRLYDSAVDPPPIYASSRGAVELEVDDEDPVMSGEQRASEEFAYESDLKNFLAANLDRIEPGLKLYDKLDGVSGVEFPVGGRYVDILALDRVSNFVVIELKVSRGYDRVVGQLLRYMAWVAKHVAAEAQGVRGVIIANSISEDLLLACSRLPDVDLYEYRLSVSLIKVGMQSG